MTHSKAFNRASAAAAAVLPQSLGKVFDVSMRVVPSKNSFAFPNRLAITHSTATTDNEQNYDLDHSALRLSALKRPDKASILKIAPAKNLRGKGERAGIAWTNR